MKNFLLTALSSLFFLSFSFTTFAADTHKKSTPSTRSDSTVKIVRTYKKYYPRKHEEIEKTLKEIRARKAPKGIPEDIQNAVNETNCYRYLCGVSYDLKTDEDHNDQAQQAAEACKKAGKIAHDLGSYTDKCNLFMSSGGVNHIGQLHGYIDDSGEGNRVRRGHRANILVPGLEKTGFGAAGNCGAMRVLNVNRSAKNPRHAVSYPGRGLFPVAYMDTTGWSYYPKNPVSGNVSVTMYKLEKPPTRALPRKGPSPKEAQVVNVHAVHVNPSKPGQYPDHGIVFEPEVPKKPNSGDIYFVRINMDKETDEYVVEFY